MKNLSSIDWKQFIVFNLAIPTIFFIFAIYFMPISQAFQFDSSDEGIELIKTSLYSQGFDLYTQIWNDQPPLSTILFSFWFRCFGESILNARLLVLCFSTLLVWSFCQTLRIYVGNIAAVIGALLLAVSCNFLRLSVSAMIGQPALAMAMMSIYMLMIYKQKSSKSAIIISGIFLGLSLQIKLFTIFLIPLIILELIKINLEKYSRHSIKYIIIDIFYWLAACGCVFLLIGFTFNSLSFEQLFGSHFDQNVKTAFDVEDSVELTLLFLLQDIDYLLLAIPTIIIILKKREWHKSFPLIWLLTAFLLILTHQPVWYHHYLLLSIPLTWLATYGVKFALDFLKNRQFSQIKINNSNKLSLSKLSAWFLVLSLILIPIKLSIITIENNKYVQASREQFELLNIVSKYKENTQWMFTDCPIYAFYSGLRVPPEVAVLSHIRTNSHKIKPEQLVSVFKNYRPEQALFCKSKAIRNYVDSQISQYYTKIFENGAGTHYILKNKL
ncbi:MAG: glycosyltransferase family 39 protein [Calothrix sp. C42_A2020_038]|nr:glycosyltransferase family 39 protein [Calothrix sp. C42_A2020_038]